MTALNLYMDAELQVLTTRPLQRGDLVIIEAHGTAKKARVTLASPNGRSIMVQFDGGLFWPGEEGAYAGIMPLFLDDQGQWRELINQKPVSITPIVS